MSRLFLGIVTASLILAIGGADAAAQRGGRAKPKTKPSPGRVDGAKSGLDKPKLDPRPDLGHPGKLDGPPAGNVWSSPKSLTRNLNPQAVAAGVAVSAHPPFSPAWYAAHPNAWKAAHPHADVWVAATAVGLATWLAVPAVPVAAVTTTAPASSEQIAAAEKVAQSGAAKVADTAEWMPLGVFALQQDGDKDPTRMIQLAVTQQGILRGAHYDLISGDAQDIQGAVDTKSLQAAFKIGTGTAVFAAPLGEFTKPEAKLAANYADGETGTWKIVRIQNQTPAAK